MVHVLRGSKLELRSELTGGQDGGEGDVGGRMAAAAVAGGAIYHNLRSQYDAFSASLSSLLSVM